jgi:hypothetical protein
VFDGGDHHQNHQLWVTDGTSRGTSELTAPIPRRQAPVLFHPRAAVCNRPWVKGMTQMVNGIYNGSRLEDVWLDK